MTGRGLKIVIALIAVVLVLFFVFRGRGGVPQGDLVSYEEAAELSGDELRAAGIKDTGWVVQARDRGEEGWLLAIDVNEEGAEGATPECLLEITDPPAEGSLPENGTKIEFRGGNAREERGVLVISASLMDR